MPDVISLKKGETIFIQGAKPAELCMLQDGALEILSASKEYEGLDAEIVISRSRRVGVIRPKTLLVGFSAMMNRPYTKSLRAIEDSQIVKYPLREGGFSAIARSDPAQAAAVLKQSFNLIASLTSGLAKYSKMLSTMQMMNDNVSLIYKSLSGSYAPDEFNDTAGEIFSAFQSGGGKLPENITARILISDCGKYLGKVYTPDEDLSMSRKDKIVLDLLTKIVKLDPDQLRSIFSADPGIPVSAYGITTESFDSIFLSTEQIIDAFEVEISRLFGGELSWSTILVDEGGFDEWLECGRVNEDFIKDMLGFIVKINSLHEELTGRKISDAYPGVKKIHQYYLKLKDSGRSTPEEDVVQSESSSGAQQADEEYKPKTSSANIASDLKRSIHQIFEFSLIDKEFQSKFLKMMTDFKKTKNPLNTEAEGRKMRRIISKFYWDLYKQVYLRSKTQSSVPKAVKLMLNFGYLDEELLESEQLEDLNELAKYRESAKTLPVLTENEFLGLVYDGTEEPSINEMGLTYSEFLKEMEKHSTKKKGEERVQVADEAVNKAMFEIEQRLASTVAVCSGSTSTAFPILTSYAIKGSLKSLQVTKKMIEDAVSDLLAIDFSPFYRETVLKLGDAREIIKENVIPYFVIIPGYGTKSQLWQDMVGNNKRSRGRIFIPSFFMGDLKKSIAHTIACYRWELNITMKGAMWGDPIEGGLTGEYFDYINTYKKMSKLSQEAKEKINERFKSLRTNRDRFADDYLNWVSYEKDGIMKVNTVVREMLFKHIPFSKDIRERLFNMPAFMQSANRYKNIHTREVLAYQRRFQKYKREDGTLPPEIENFFRFLEL